MRRCSASTFLTVLWIQYGQLTQCSRPRWVCSSVRDPGALKTRIPSLIDLQDQINEGSAAPNRTPVYCQSLKLTRPPALTHSICFFCCHSPSALAYQWQQWLPHFPVLTCKLTSGSFQIFGSDSGTPATIQWPRPQNGPFSAYTLRISIAMYSDSIYRHGGSSMTTFD